MSTKTAEIIQDVRTATQLLEITQAHNAVEPEQIESLKRSAKAAADQLSAINRAVLYGDREATQ